MPDNTDNKAFQELVRVLEEAVKAGANSIGLEYKGRELMVFHQSGPLGFGAGRIANELRQAVIEELVRRAGLSRKSRGKLRAHLLGKEYAVVVEEYDSFGESAFNLTLKERKKKADGESMPRKKKKKKQPAQLPGPMRWAFERGIPTYDFFDGMSLDNTGGLEDAVENFIYNLENGDFLTWEAVVCQEQGLPLTAQQEEALDSLISFDDPDDEPILYINEIPRPSAPWHVILNKIVPHLLMEPFRTFDVHQEVKADGWPQIMAALGEFGQGLSLPSGVASLTEVVPADLYHKLWLQYCFEILGGLGQGDDLYLDEEDPWRVDKFILGLREYKESVAYFGLTLDALLTRVILPERDRPLFVKLMQDRLGLNTCQEPIADHL